jgi:hypothetical protein
MGAGLGTANGDFEPRFTSNGAFADRNVVELVAGLAKDRGRGLGHATVFAA